MKLPAWTPLVFAAVLALLGSVYVESEGQTAIVLNLGTVVRTDVGPGLHFKWPLVESARVFDRRLQVIDSQPERFMTVDQQDISVDFFAIGRIENVRTFYRATGGDETVAGAAPGADHQERAQAGDQLAHAAAGESLPTACVWSRSSWMRSTRAPPPSESTSPTSASSGIDLPEDSDVLKSVYSQMRSRRQQVASRLRAEGVEQSRTIRAQATATRPCSSPRRARRADAAR